MSFARSGPDRSASFDSSYAPSSGYAEYGPLRRERTPEDQLADMIATAQRHLSQVLGHTLPALSGESAQLGAAEGARPHDELKREAAARISESERARAAVVAFAAQHGTDATPMLASFDASLAHAKQELAAAPEAPSRFASFEHEAEIVALAQRRTHGPEARREQAGELVSAFSQLAPRDRRALRKRLAQNHRDDPVAQAFACIVEYRGMLLGVLDGSQRVHVAPTSPHIGAAAPGPSASSPAAGSAPIAAAGPTPIASGPSSTSARPAGPPSGEAAHAEGPREAQALRAALAAHDGARALTVLARNVERDAMTALRVAYGDAFGDDLRSRLTAEQFARACGYAGDQISLAARLAARDSEGIFADLERMPDAEAYALLFDAATPTALPADERAEHGAGAAPSKMEAVRDALRRELGADDYARAMRLLLAKAQRVASRADEGALAARLVRRQISTERVALAEERIRAADRVRGVKGEMTAVLAVADLDADERRALAQRLDAQPLAHAREKASPLGEAALLQREDATVIQQAILAAKARGAAHAASPDGVALEVALERAGALLRTARAKAQDPQTSQSARAAAQHEVQRLQALFYDSADGAKVLGAATASATTPDAKKDRLEVLGLDPVALGAELLAPVWATDAQGMIAVLQQIPAAHRRAAMDRANKTAEVIRLPPEQRKLVQAYVDVGETYAPKPDEEMITLSTPFGDWVPPSVTIALADVLQGISRGPSGAASVLRRLQQLAYPQRKVLFAQPEYRKAIASLPRGEERSEERDFFDALQRAETGETGPELAIANYPNAAAWQTVSLEHVRLLADKAGRATMRRGYVLAEQCKANPSLQRGLSPSDRRALQSYQEVAAHRPLYDDPTQAQVAEDIAFGSVQLTDAAEGVLDANHEAEFMRLRLQKAVGLRAGTPLGSWNGSPAAIEALTEFDTLYETERAGGIHRGALAQLAEIYYRALRQIEQHKRKVTENEALASMAATVAGVVVAVGVSMLSAGTAIPMVAAAALGGSAAGAASAAAGAAVRLHTTSGGALRDFGKGVVEGVTAIASAGLAASVVRRAAAGLEAGHAAASVGSRLVQQATGHHGAALLAETMLDGAFSGAAGELFATAAEEATWDRGVGEALAKMLAAVARGGAIGAAAGGLMGGLARLAKRIGHDAAEGVGTLLDRSAIGRAAADGLPDHAHDELVRVHQLIEAHQLGDAEHAIQRVEGLGAKHRELLLTYARGRSMLRVGASQGIELGSDVRGLEFVDEATFRQLTGGAHAHAAVVIRRGEPVILAHQGTPLSALREELTHLRQWETSAVMRARMESLSEERLAHWKDLPPKQKLAMHIDRLELEADAQRQIGKQLSGSEHDPDAVLRILDAEEALFLTTERLQLLRNAKPPLDVAALEIDQAPRIYSSTAQSAKPSGRGARKAQKLLGENVNEAAVKDRLKDLGYRMHQFGDTKEIFRLPRAPDRSSLPHLSVERDGTIIAGKPRQSFAEQKADAAMEWGTQQRDFLDLASKLERGKLEGHAAERAQRELAANGWKTVRPELQRLVRIGQIDEATAGMVANWGQVLEELQARFGVDIKALLAKHLRSKSITSAELSDLRGELREITAAQILKLRGTKRAEVLHEMLALQPDEASKGYLFTEYRREAMRAEKIDGNPLYGVSDSVSPESFSGSDLVNRRTPDDVVHVREAVENQLGVGRYAVEDKTGPGAFKIEQAEDYARRAYKPGKAGGGFTQTKGSTKTVYDGLIYVFSTETEAIAGRESMQGNRVVQKLLDKEPGGIHIMYINRVGKVTRL